MLAQVWSSEGRPERGSNATAVELSCRAGLGMPLETKLYPPGPRREWVQRQELTRQLSASTARLVLVDGPAGFGKTTLVAQWRAHAAQQRRFAWVSLDRGDNDPVRLWSHVVEALQRTSPELGDHRLGLVRGPRHDLTRTLLPLLVNGLAAVQIPVVLVLDDYHLIRDRSCHQQLEFLLLHLPPGAQLVVITRADPPLPLARLRARGDLTEIRPPELGFTTAQAASLVRSVAGVELSQSDAADLVERTEGWAAGIYMVALSLRDNPDPEAFIHGFTGSNRFVADFLTEEVLSRQPYHVRQFLARTAILERFTAELCDTVAGTANAAEIIDLLERENLFVAPLDDHRQWFRYHHLFAQMLRNQLTRTEPDVLPELHRRASTWHRLEGSAEEAIRHALAAGDPSAAADLIARNWHVFVSAGQTATVRRWLRSLGDHQIRDNPVAAHVAAFVAAVAGEPGPVRRWLPVIESGCHDGPLPDGVRSLRSSAALIRGTIGFDGIRAKHDAAAVAVALETDPASRWYALAWANLGWCRYLAAEPGAAAALGRAVRCEAQTPVIQLAALTAASLVATEEGRIGQAEELADAARRLADDSGLGEVPLGSAVWTAIGAVHASQGELDEARAEFEHAVRSRHRFGVIPWYTFDALLRLAEVLIDIGEPAEAAALLDEVGQQLTMLPDGAQAQHARRQRLEQRLEQRLKFRPPLTWDLAEALTEREEAVLRMLRGTLSLREIGQELYLSANTIKTHTRAIYRKLGASNRAEAVQRGHAVGLLR
jgi:LuxR family transcriptional regulator, maltose regulon positive regulatory protein